MSDETNVPERIAVLEVKVENNEKLIGKLETTINDNYSATLAIKERLDKFNGAIPHLAEDVKDMRRVQDTLVTALTKNTIEDTKSDTKMKVMWSIFGAIGSALVAVAIKLLIGK